MGGRATGSVCFREDGYPQYGTAKLKRLTIKGKKEREGGANLRKGECLFQIRQREGPFGFYILAF